MKRIYEYIGLAFVASAMAVACDKNAEPVFDDKDAFVAFEKTSYTVSEDYSVDGKIFAIPVTLASVKGIETTIRFEVTEPETNGAVAGTNYELVTAAGVLSFDAEHRTSYIKIKTLPDGDFTGDLKINIELFGNEEVNVGSENLATLTFSDVDHPLTAFFGTYTMSGTKYGASSPVSWEMEIFKDPEDVTMVWFYNLMGNSGWAGDDIVYYGVVNEDKTEITLPFGQESEYKYGGTTPVTLLGLSSDLYGHDTGSLIIKVKEEAGKLVLDFGTEYGLWFYIEDTGSIGTYIAGPGITAVKN